MQQLSLAIFLTTLGIEYINHTQKDPIDKTLRFDDKGEFTILQLTDLHYGESEDKDRNNLMIQDKLMEYIKPDLAVLTGDMVSGFAWDGKDQTFFQRQWKKFTKVFNDKKTLYAYALGNHDHQANLQYHQIADLDQTHPYSLFIQGEVNDNESASNYLLPLYSGIKGRENEITTGLWVLDSKDTGCKEIEESYACFNDLQQEWVIQKSQQLEEQQNKKVNGLTFFHIPPQEFMYVWNLYPTVGRKREDVCCPRKNTGMFNILKNYARTKAIYVGHDHNNDYKGYYEGVELVYGRKTGYGCYGPKGMQKGATVIKLKEFINDKGETDFKVRSYIIQEDGSILDEQDYKWQGNEGEQFQCNF